VIGAEDVLSISVYDQPQFTVLSQSVRPDGIISMPLVGEVKATGKTPRQLETEIAKTLSDQYLRTTPRVMVTINTVKSRYFLIEGGVNKPGRYDLLVPTTIIQALVNAGGFHEFANTKKINLLREGKVFVVFNFNDAIKGKHPEQNVYLKHGDLIAVKE
jgi:polysaccharide export outer membrane protein